MAATSSGRPGRPIAIFAKIRAAKPDVVIGGVAASDLTTFLKQWNELGMKGKIPFAEISVGNTDLWGFGLDSDVVFGVKDSLIRDFVLHPPGSAPDGQRMDRPYVELAYDFRLAPLRVA
jgi:hypothetical protein